MMKRIAFMAVMAIVYPLSMVPLSILYVLSDLMYYCVYYFPGYRKKIVFSNLRNAFPDKSNDDLRIIAKNFYRNFCDIIIENVKLINFSREDVARRCTFSNLELVNDLCDRGKSVIMTLGHCGNWELTGLAASLAVKQHTITFYRTIKNIYFDRFSKNIRGKFGMELVPQTKARMMIRQEGKQPNMYIFITDQTPSNVHTSYWTRFLNQDTSIFKGAEKFAKLTGHPVLHAEIQRAQRGYYTVEFKILRESPERTTEGEITELHTRALENDIVRNPDNWLWTHRRWKLKKPVTK